MSRDWHISKLAWLSCLLLALAACSKGGVQPQQAFPEAGTIAGWHRSRAADRFDRETLYDLVDGQAEAYFAYSFEQATVQSYEDTVGQRVDVEIWQVATPADAYGIFTANRAGDPIDLGNGGDADPGRRVGFWQDRYYVRVRTLQELPDAVLQEFAQAVARALPAGGERPALVDRLPGEGFVAPGVLFFHEEISVQSELWLGGQNVLGLSPDTDGVLATYDLNGVSAQLLLVEYSTADEAVAACGALVNAGVDGLVSAESRGALLGAVFGGVDGATAGEWLSEALGD